MRILITGASGYVARVTFPFLFADDDITSITGLDVRDPDIAHPKFSFVNVDVRSGGIDKYLEGIDAVVHMAFIVGETKNKKEIYDINVNGSRRVLEAVAAAEIEKLVVASSVSAYGTRPNQGVITEETPLAGNTDSYYSHTKLKVEKMLDRFERKNPEISVTRLRPSILCGAETDNFFLDLIENELLFFPMSNPGGIPLVHEKDVGRAFHMALKSDATGAFNIHAGLLSFREMARIIGMKSLGAPFFVLKPLADIAFKLGFSPVSSHWLVLSRYPLQMKCERAEKLLGWRPEYSPEQAFREMVQEHKK